MKGVTNGDKDTTKNNAKKKAANKKKKEKDKKLKTFMQKMAEEDPTDEEEEGTDMSFCTISKCNLDKVKLKDMLLLDNQSTVDLLCNQKLVSNICQVHDVMTVMGNGGKLTTHTKANLKGYGEVWFDKQAITNILSLKLVLEKEGFKVMHSSKGDHGFAVHKSNGTIIHF
jgi:hypothetical protein